MKKTLKNKLLALSSLIMAVAVALGMASFNRVKVDASEPELTPSVQMLNGARVKTAGERTFLVYEAVVNDYLEEGYEYGFVVMDKETFTTTDFSGGYHIVSEDLTEVSIIDAFIVDVSTSKGTADIKGYFEVTDFDTSYIAIAYVHESQTENFSYAEVSVENNARSASFVAQMAINYDGVDEARYEELAPIAGDTDYMYSRFSAVSGENTGINVEGEKVSFNEGDNFVVEASLGRFSWDPGYERGMVSKVNYEAITEVSFDVMIPAEANVSWWGFTPLASVELGDAYIGAATMANLGSLNMARDTWHTVKYVTVDGITWDVYYGLAGASLTEENKAFTYTIPENEIANYKNADGKSYLAIIGEYGRNNVNLFVQLDNFNVVANYGEEYADSFDNAQSSMFDFGTSQLGGKPARIVLAGKAGIELNSNLGVDYAARINTGDGNAREGYHSFQTREKYQGITEITFDAYVEEDSSSDWWGISFTDKTEQDNYTDAAAGFTCLNSYGVKGKWVSYKYETTDGQNWTISYALRGSDLVVAGTKASVLNVNNTPAYVYFAVCPTNPGAQGVRINIDNVVITTGEGSVRDNFTDGKSQLFIERADPETDPVTFVPAIVEEVEEPIAGEGHAVLNFTSFGEGAFSVATKQAYSNITEFSVDMYIPSANEDNVWFGFTPVSTTTGVDAYYAACTGGLNLNTSVLYYGWTDKWVTIKYVVTNGVWKQYIAIAGTDEFYTEDRWTLDANGADYSANGTSYIALSACPAKTFNWGAWIDNLTIVADGETYVDDFNTGATQLLNINPSVVEYVVEYDVEEAPEGEGHVEVNLTALTEGGIAFYSNESYAITELYADVYIPSANEDNVWFGFTPSSKGSAAGAYDAACTGGLNLNNSVLYYGWTDKWVTLKYVVTDGVWRLYIALAGTDEFYTENNWTLDATGADFSAGGSSYVILSACPAKTFNWSMKFDNIVIVTADATYTENFNREELSIFAIRDTNAITHAYTAPEGYEPPVEEPQGPQTLLEHMVAGVAHEYFANNDAEATVNVGFGGYDQVGEDQLSIAFDIRYKVGSGSEFVIMLSDEDFIYVCENNLLLYAGGAIQGGTSLKTQYVHELRIAILGNGTVLVSADYSDFVNIGNADADCLVIKGISIENGVVISEINYLHPLQMYVA